MDTNSYVTFLLIGAVLVLLDGQVIYRNGRRYLREATPTQRGSAESLTRLVTALFHLVTLGVLALISIIDVPVDDPLQSIVVRLGVVLIIIGIAHWIAVTALTRIRDRQEFDELYAEQQARRQAHDQAMAAYGTDIPDPTESPAYNGESATEIINEQRRTGR